MSDLTRENFTVVEDGQPQRIESFVMVQGGRSYNLLTPAAPGAAPDGLVLPQAKPKGADAATGRVFLILIDEDDLFVAIVGEPGLVRFRPALLGEAQRGIGEVPVRRIGPLEGIAVEGDPVRAEQLLVAAIAGLGRVREGAVPIEQHGA